MTTCILNHTSFIYGISWRTKITKKNWISPIGSFLKQPKSTHEYIICSDEAYFYLTLSVNIQNNRQWSKSQRYIGTEMPLYDQQILVWCAISANRVFGPYYFEDTVNQHNYLEMLKIFFWTKVLRTAEYKNGEKYYFQQDGLALIQLGQYKHD